MFDDKAGGVYISQSHSLFENLIKMTLAANENMPNVSEINAESFAPEDIFDSKFKED